MTKKATNFPEKMFILSNLENTTFESLLYYSCLSLLVLLLFSLPEGSQLLPISLPGTLEIASQNPKAQRGFLW